MQLYNILYISLYHFSSCSLYWIVQSGKSTASAHISFHYCIFWSISIIITSLSLWIITLDILCVSIFMIWSHLHEQHLCSLHRTEFALQFLLQVRLLYFVFQLSTIAAWEWRIPYLWQSVQSDIENGSLAVLLVDGGLHPHMFSFRHSNRL